MLAETSSWAVRSSSGAHRRRTRFDGSTFAPESAPSSVFDESATSALPRRGRKSARAERSAWCATAALFASSGRSSGSRTSLPRFNGRRPRRRRYSRKPVAGGQADARRQTRGMAAALPSRSHHCPLLLDPTGCCLAGQEPEGLAPPAPGCSTGRSRGIWGMNGARRRPTGQRPLRVLRSSTDATSRDRLRCPRLSSPGRPRRTVRPAPPRPRPTLAAATAAGARAAPSLQAVRCRRRP